MGQVGEAVTQLDQATQQNAALVEEMAAARQTGLRSQAEQMGELVGTFTLEAAGHAQQRRAPRRPHVSASLSRIAAPA